MERTCADTMLTHIKAHTSDYFDKARRKPSEALSDIEIFIDILNKRKTDKSLSLIPLSTAYFNQVIHFVQKCTSNDRDKLRNEVISLFSVLESKLVKMIPQDEPIEVKKQRKKKKDVTPIVEEVLID